MTTPPDYIWYNGRTQHAKELLHKPPEEGSAQPTIPYVRRDSAVLAELPEVRALVAAETERCAQIAERFGPDRPIVATSPKERIIGRWEGEQAASANIAAAIREGRDG